MKKNADALNSGRAEITIFDAVNFLVANWRLYLVGLVLGGAIGFAVVYFKPSYTAEGVLNYRVVPKANLSDAFDIESNADARFDLIAWRSIQNRLTNLAQEMSGGERDKPQLVMGMTSPEWWAQHVTPVYALTNAEAKELLGINGMVIGTNKPTEESESTRFLARAIKESTRIDRLVVNVSGSSAEQALSGVSVVMDFVRQGVAYLDYRALVESLARSLLASESRIAAESQRISLDLAALQRRKSELMRLQQEFPGTQTPAQIVNLREGDAKFLPLANQLIAANVEISATREQLAQLQQQSAQDEVTAAFVRLAGAVVARGMNNPRFTEELFGAEAAIRAKIPQNDPGRELAVNNIRGLLNSAQVSVQSRLTQASTPQIVQQPLYARGLLRGAALGLALGLFLSLLISLIRVSARRAAVG